MNEKTAELSTGSTREITPWHSAARVKSPPKKPATDITKRPGQQ